MDPQFTTRFLGELHDRSKAADPETSLMTTLHSVFESIVHGDFDAFAGHVTDDVELHMSGSDIFDGSWHGRAEVLAAARRNYGMVRDQKPEIEATVSEGNMIAVLFRESGVVKADESPYRVRAVQWFTFDGGKIRKIDAIAARV